MILHQFFVGCSQILLKLKCSTSTLTLLNFLTGRDDKVELRGFLNTVIINALVFLQEDQRNATWKLKKQGTIFRTQTYITNKHYIEICRNCGESPTFYHRPFENGTDNELRFSQQSIGLNKLFSIMKTLFLEAGIPGYYTNHSGKHTLATTSYQAGVPKTMRK